jgi:hypothetical protein
VSISPTGNFQISSAVIFAMDFAFDNFAGYICCRERHCLALQKPYFVRKILSIQQVPAQPDE